jgi:hypothetical protein
VSVDDRVIGSGRIGGVTGRIMTAYEELVRAQGTSIDPAPSARAIVAGYRV